MTFADPSRPRRHGVARALPAALMLVAASLVTSPSPAAAVEPPPFADWTMLVDVTDETIGPGYSDVFLSHFTDADPATLGFRWRGSRNYATSIPCGPGYPADARYTTSGSGSGSGDGSWQGTTSLPAEWGLSPTANWTKLWPETSGTFETQDTVTPCIGETQTFPQVLEPAKQPLFLPGTAEELDAMAVGTVLEGEYSRVLVSTNHTQTITVSYWATKGELPPEIDVKAQYAYVGVLGSATGGETVEITGTGVSSVTEVCFTSVWSATAATKDSGFALWNGIAAQDLSFADGDSVADIDRKASGRNLTQIVTMHYCMTPLWISATELRATYPQALLVTPSISGVPITSISHSSSIEVLAGANLLESVPLGTSKSAGGKKLLVSWGWSN